MGEIIFSKAFYFLGKAVYNTKGKKRVVKLEKCFSRYHKLNASIIDRIREKHGFFKRRKQSAFGSKRGETSLFSFIAGIKTI